MSYQLKPLAHPCPETTANGVTKSRWGFAGQALYQKDVDHLTEKGVDWEKDIMPDGRLKHPRFRRFRLANREKGREKRRQEEDARRQGLTDKYMALPEPRPPFFQWAATEEIFSHYFEVKKISRCAKRDSDRIKALSVLLEHGLAKPKSTVEVQAQQDSEPIPIDRLLEIALEANGFSVETFREFAKKHVQ